MPEFYIMFACKFFPDFFSGGGGTNPFPPSPTPMAGPQASHQQNPALVNTGADLLYYTCNVYLGLLHCLARH